MKEVRLILIGFFLLGIALWPNLLPQIDSNQLNYTFGFNRGDVNSSISNTLQAYFPMNHPPGTYQFAPLGNGNSTRGGGALKVYPYPITVNYSVHFDGYFPSNGSTPWFRIRRCAPNGTIQTNGDLVNYANGNGVSGSFTLSANQGCYVELNTGSWWRSVWIFSSETMGYTCNYTISYKLDDMKPAVPTGFTICDNQDGGLYKSGNIQYTQYNPVVLSWDPGVDPSSSSAPSSGVDGYFLDYNNQSYWISKPAGFYNDNTNQLFVNEGQYTVQLKVKDIAGNFSVPGSLTFFVDKSISNVILPSSPVQIIPKPDGTYDIQFTWNQLQNDVSGVKKYQIALTDNLSEPIGGWVEIIDLQQNQYTFTSQTVAETPLYIQIRAVDNVNNIGNWTKTSAFKIWSPTVSINTTPKAVEQNSRITYSADLHLEDNPEVFRYIIEREGPTSIAPIILTYQHLKNNHFSYTDSDNLIKHGLYRYSVYTENEYGIKSGKNITPYILMPNVAPHAEISGPRPIVVYTDATFTLGKFEDLENDSLEYRLYTRTPGTETGILMQSWTPATENQKVTISFPDKTTLEWQICCIEKDATIPDRTEVSLTGWNQLYIDTRYPLPHCFNVFGENLWGTKGQELRFEVETNPTAHFTSYVWNFGDGSSIVGGTETTHTYRVLSEPEAPYIVTVTATDDTGVQYTGTIKIHIVNTSKGRLYADEIWSGTHTIVEDVVVPAGIKLTIESGTVVQVKQGCNLRVSGELTAIDPGKGVQFAGESPVSTWQGIRFDGAGTGTLDGVTVNRAVRGVACTGNGSIILKNDTFSQNDTGLHCYSGTVKVTGCTFQDNTVYGIKEDNGCNPMIENCIFQGNGINYYDQNLFELSVEQLNTEPNHDNKYR
jgi:hypothetical protein